MIHGQSTKAVALFAPQSVATNGTATGTVSVAGYDYAQIILTLSTAVASNVDVTVTLTESDGTTYVTNTDLALTTVAPQTSNPQVYEWFVDMRKHKKNLKITYAPNANVARVASALALLSRAEQAPTTIAQKGLDAQVIA